MWRHLLTLKGQPLLKEALFVQEEGEEYPVDTITAPVRGRSAVLNYGAEHASGDILLFLHADTRLPLNALNLITENGEKAGAFSLRFSAANRMLNLIGYLTSLRSRVLNLPYGDQGLFMPKKLFKETGGFTNVPILEDVILAKKVRPTVLKECVTTSPRRYRKNGILKTVLQHRLIMLGFMLGFSPERLAKLR
jgi:glycosyltransferase involved in cell wall biosynthesis